MANSAPGNFDKSSLTCNIELRDVMDEDLPIFFEQQLDPEANFMAAFTAKDPNDREAFNKKWTKILGDNKIKIKTIIFNKEVAGHIVRHESFGDPEVSYWIGKEYWGRGIATRALREFLPMLSDDPLFARAAKDNLASIRVLEKCGFKYTGSDRGFANGRGEKIEESIFKFDT